MPGAAVQIPTTRYRLLKEFMQNVTTNCYVSIKCKGCKKYFKQPFLSSESIACISCRTQLQRSEYNYFVHFDVRGEITRLLQRNWKEVTTFIREKHGERSDCISDIHNGTLLESILQEDVFTLSFVLNSDGVKPKKSNHGTLWPVQLICNVLPPHLRFNKSNIIISDLYYGEKKPDLNDYFGSFAEDIEDIEENGITVNDLKFRVYVTHGTFDLPAKSEFQQLTQYNGNFGCGYCTHPGQSVDGFIRYPFTSTPYPLRTDSQMTCAMHKLDEAESTHCSSARKRQKKATPQKRRIEGVKGVSTMILFKKFDLVFSFCIDYMHCVLLGVMDDLLELWLSSKNHTKDFYIKPASQRVLNDRLLKIKPCDFISRLPRSLDDRKLFKASEYRSLLIYYLPVILRGMQSSSKYYQHFMLLSSSIYMFLGVNITDEVLNTGEDRLNQFVQQYEELYGLSAINMNTHLLLHLAMIVRKNGPLWAQSMFPFESNHHNIMQYIHGNTDVLSQITTKHLIHVSLEKSNRKRSFELSDKVDIDFSDDETHAMRTFGCASNYTEKIDTFLMVKRHTRPKIMLKVDQGTIVLYLFLLTTNICSEFFSFFLNFKVKIWP